MSSHAVRDYLINAMTVKLPHHVTATRFWLHSILPPQTNRRNHTGPSITVLALSELPQELQAEIKLQPQRSSRTMRIAKEVERICQKSARYIFRRSKLANPLAGTVQKTCNTTPRFQTRPRRAAFSPRGYDLPPCCFFPLELELPSSLQHD